LATVTFALASFLLSSIYPGPDALETFVSIPLFQALIGITDVQNPGMLIWLLIFFCIFLLTNFYPVVGIFFGVQLLPFGDKDGKELIFSTEKSLIWYFVENFIVVIFIIPASIVPAFLISNGFLLSSGSGGDFSAFTIASILPVFFVFVVTMVTALGCSIKFSNKLGYAFGGLFFIVSFTLNLLYSEIERIEELAFINDFNLMSQIGSFEHAIAGTWNEEFILKCLFLVLLLSVLILFFLYRTDYIETRSSYRKERSIGGIRTKISFIRTPIESLLSRVGWKYPAFRDQLQSTAGIFLLYLTVTSLLQALIAQNYPGDEEMALLFSEMTAVLDTPIFAAFVFGHPMTPTFGGFVILKYFTLHWIFYGPFLFIMTYSIILRDKTAGYDEITWSNPRTRPRIIVGRTIATIVYLWLILIMNFVALYSSELLLSTYRDIVVTDFWATGLTFIYLGMGYSIFLILFVAFASIPRLKYIPITLIGIFLIALFIPVIWYINQDLSWMLYLSPFYYIDVAGILLKDILLEQVIPEILIFGAVSILFFISILKFWTPRRDIA
jgi:ABC-2 type transport system permease protein